MLQTRSKYFRFACCDRLEALSASHHKTSFPFHFHSTFNLSLVFKGSFNTQLTSRFIKSPSGSLLITNPGEIHANPCSKVDALSFFTFYISQEFMEYCHEHKTVFFPQNTIDHPGLFSSFHELSQRLRENGETNIERAFIKTLKRLIESHAGSHEETNHKKQIIFQHFLEEENFEKFSLDDTAKRFGMDKFKFIRLFKYQTGLTPNNYFIYRRIEKSKVMLEAGKDLLSIAVELGFYDAAHYCHHFKKFTGISPLAFVAGS